MSRAWIREEPPCWDADKARIIGGAGAEVFGGLPAGRAAGEVLGGDWWRVEDDGRTVGFGWMDTVWGDGEILLAVDPDARGQGVGGFILDRLEAEAAARGLRYVYNVVASTHPKRAEVTVWLEGRGFAQAERGRLQRQVSG